MGAFDIDGTLTSPHSTKIDTEMASLLAQLLQRGVPVVLITGRGRSTTRNAVNQILKITNLEHRYASRLHCITHNGLLWLKAPTTSPELLLSEEIKLSPDFPELIGIKDKLLSNPTIMENQSRSKLYITDEPKENLYALRVTLANASKQLIEEVSQIIRGIAKEFSTTTNNIFITLGKYGELYSFDITNTNKVKAIEYFSKKTGIRLDEILRVGDRGDETGNDYELLNSSRAFSVDRLGSQTDKCFPVLDNNYNKQLRGVQATKTLLGRVNIHPPLTLTPDPDHQLLKALHQFEKAAASRTRREYQLLLSQMKLRLDRLFMSDSAAIDVQSFSDSDIYERLNGGVRMRDWEVTELPPTHKLRMLFGLTEDVLHTPKNARLEWALLTDTAILLRGPKYYWAMTNKVERDGYIAEYATDILKFIENSRIAIKALADETISFSRYKFLLAIMDNVRNALIQFQYASYVSDNIATTGFEMTKRFFRLGVLRHTEMHLSAILDANIQWMRLLAEYLLVLRDISQLITEAVGWIAPYERLYHKPLLRKWRECDDFLQNVLAVEIGLHEFEGILLKAGRGLENIYTIGLAYGGIELPVISAAISKSKGIPLTSGFINLSLYSNQVVREKMMSGEMDDEGLMANENPINSLVLFDKKKSKPDLTRGVSIVLDDNCTTGRTIQTARDILVRAGAEVIGAIAVRYPASNRYAQMQFPNHGLPDPEILLSFIRGLVSPSPYTRLMRPHPENQYLDSSGIFDISRWELERHLRKNQEEKDS